MATRVPHDPETTEHIEHYERERVVERPYVRAPASNVNVGSSATAPVAAVPWVDVVTRVIALLITAIDVLLLGRFALKLLGANAQQPLVAALNRVTDPLVRPFQGIFPEPAGPPVVDIAALLSVIFISLLGALVIALVRATRPPSV